MYYSLNSLRGAYTGDYCRGDQGGILRVKTIDHIGSFYRMALVAWAFEARSV